MPILKTKEVNIHLDIEAYNNQVSSLNQRGLVPFSEKKFDTRTTVFSTGKDPRVGTDGVISPPTVTFIEILRDGLNNPYVKVNWKVARKDIARANISNFAVFRRKLDVFEFFRTRGLSPPTTKFNVASFDRINRGIPRRGRFSPERKAISQIKPSLIDPSVLNINQFTELNLSRNRYVNNLNSGGVVRRFFNPLDKIYTPTNEAGFLNFVANKDFEKVGIVSLEKFLERETKKFVFTQNADFVDLFFKDISVKFGEAYEYYITSIPKSVSKSVQSNSVSFYLDDPTSINPPEQVLIKQISASRCRISLCANSADEVAKGIIYKKSKEDFIFRKIAVLPNGTDCINFIDKNVEEGKTYIYRCFFENIFGTLSEPKEVVFYSSTAGLVDRSKSNNLQIPVLTVQPDQNTDYIKITVSVNDPLVSYYEIDRRDLSIFEKKFSVPSQISNGYGGNGWRDNKFFVERNQSLEDSSSDILTQQSAQNEITVIDDTVQIGHIYQYRVVGKDLFGNQSSYQLQVVKAVGKKTIRTPINISATTLRDNPFRIKLTWEDDNLHSRYETEEVFKVESSIVPDNVKVVYRVQRRVEGENKYDTFPNTANNFIVDEVLADDAVPFLAKKAEDSFGPLPDREQSLENVVANIQSTTLTTGVKNRVSFNRVERSFNMPGFLRQNTVYYYRVAALNDRGEESNYSNEVKVVVVPKLAEPLNFKVQILNSNVRPLVASLTWTSDPLRLKPDRWRVERKFDSINDTFEVVGYVYFEEQFFDRQLEAGRSYIYRIKSLDSIGRESDYFEARLST